MHQGREFTGLEPGTVGLEGRWSETLKKWPDSDGFWIADSSGSKLGRQQVPCAYERIHAPTARLLIDVAESAESFEKLVVERDVFSPPEGT